MTRANNTGGLGNTLHRHRKKKAEASRANYKEAVLAAQAGAPPVREDDVREEKKKLTSIWQTSELDDFLSIATEREQGFQAERNVRVVVGGQTHVVVNDKVQPLTDTRNWFELSDKLPIPHRPRWTYEMSAEELQTQEKQHFLNWRRGLSEVEEAEKVTMTPYEKNLEVWRQLWRVVERADIVLEIVDSRNPLAFRCKDFESYVATHQTKAKKPKRCLLLLNKADLLTEAQRKVWAEYLTGRGFEFFFFSASEELYKQEKDTQVMKEINADLDSDEEPFGLGEQPAAMKERKRRKGSRRKGTLKGNPVNLQNPYAVPLDKKPEPKKAPVETKAPEPTEQEISRDERNAAAVTFDPWDVLSPELLLDRLAAFRQEAAVEKGTPLMVGLVGYPNVGKSSTINAIIGSKRVVVSSTPGKTKHFQTLNIPNERRVMLCDCPGLVFPSFAATKDSMICDGVLPVDTVKDYVSPVGCLCQRIPRIVFETLFKINLDPKLDVDDSTTYADLLLNYIARRRGLMTDHDKPNRSKAAKDLLKMYVDGDLVYVHPPPGFTIEQQNVGGVPEATAAPAEEKEDDLGEEGDETGSDDEWEDISSASEARGLSDDEESLADLEEAPVLPTFFSRRKQTGAQALTEVEAFNLESNVHIMKPATAKFSKTKKRNPQLEPDMTVFINEEGKKELIIDSDDGIVECEGFGSRVVQREKRKTKRAQRREERRVAKSSQGAVKLPS